MPNSMTGFARQEIQAAWGALSCEVRSVNHRYLESHIRLSESLRGVEPFIRELCRQQLHRGKVEINLQLSPNALVSDTLVINQPLVQGLIQACSETSQLIENKHMQVASIDLLRLLQWPEVIKQQSLDIEAIEVAAKTLLRGTFAKLIQHRQREGVELAVHIEQRLGAIGQHVDTVRQQIPEILAAQQAKLQQRLLELQVDADPDRLAQEVAILVNKADVDEELDRLVVHIAEVKHILQQKGRAIALKL
jgi:uncharacterized protein (TIGR00255 family)